ncbi:hypothetical protein Aple_025290 [Acrocarpospora pleiomorpha]|uniref:Uncharacterized protein n=1 Tax=Acrocarpospora pleiomorpha TaxID=90975 RepID=A0A5M3XKG7_9ACTN|nr:hypothetical protein [Acrocarpospora pleiomorpha]GES19633.1 hypothetical protein Aple_025290 [Acrocarpospora pleiomorpha]
MNRQLTVNLVTDARLIADNAEQMAHEVRRTAAAIKVTVHNLTVIYNAVRPFVEWLKSKQADPQAKVHVLVSTERMS